MTRVSEHIIGNLLAGIAALLPASATIIAIVYAENFIAQTGLGKQWFYFPGVGILMVIVGLYLAGVLVSTLLGQWAVSLVDRILRRVPLLDALYRTAKSCLGLSEGDDSLFRQAVILKQENGQFAELAFLTNRVTTSDGKESKVVFVPSSPNPLYGRMILVPADAVEPAGMPVREAMRAFLTVGSHLPASLSIK